MSPEIGQMVAWFMLDGYTMAGKVQTNDFGYSRVERVDGTFCRVENSRLRAASLDEIDSACQFFANIGK
jgi:hypothetical protein